MFDASWDQVVRVVGKWTGAGIPKLSAHMVRNKKGKMWELRQGQNNASFLKIKLPVSYQLQLYSGDSLELEVNRERFFLLAVKSGMSDMFWQAGLCDSEQNIFIDRDPRVNLLSVWASLPTS